MYTKTPIYLDLTVWLLPDDAPRQCKQLLPERCFTSSSLLVKALCGALEVSEEKLRLDVKHVLYEAYTDVAVVVDKWLL